MLVPGLAVDGFSRYLRAKKSVDDRSLNLRVYQKLHEALAGSRHIGPWRLMEIGCGIGTMIERLWDWDLVPLAAYTAVDREAALIAEARVRLEEFCPLPSPNFCPGGRGLPFDGRRARLADFLSD